jgi:hypothetical protein
MILNKPGLFAPKPLPDLVDRLIAANVHAACDIGEAEYRRIWPSEVPHPTYAADGLVPVLVDRRADAKKVMEAVGILGYDDLPAFQTSGTAAQTEALERYVAFVRLNVERTGWTPDEIQLHKHEVHLNVIEGLFLAVQYPMLFERHGWDCVGSFAGEPNMVASYDRRRDRTFLVARNVSRPKPHIGYATRHRYFAPVF